MKLLFVLLVTAAGFVFGSVQSQYPDKPVTFVVPFPPGDLEDVLTRIIAEDFQNETGVAAAVINKPGGGGPIPGAMEVANGPTDGSMIGSFVNDVTVVGPDLGIDGLNVDTFDVLGIFLTYPFVIATSADAPYKTIQQLAEYAKSNKLALGHFGAPFAPTKVTLALAKELGFEWGSEAGFDMLDCNTLASKDADVVNTTIQLILPCLDKVNILVSVTANRLSKALDSPTVGEIVPSLNVGLWNGLFVKSDVPQEARDKITEIAKKSVLGDKAQSVAQETGAEVYWMDAAEAEAQIERDRQVMKEIDAMLGS